MIRISWDELRNSQRRGEDRVARDSARRRGVRPDLGQIRRCTPCLSTSDSAPVRSRSRSSWRRRRRRPSRGRGPSRGGGGGGAAGAARARAITETTKMREPHWPLDAYTMVFASDPTRWHGRVGTETARSGVASCCPPSRRDLLRGEQSGGGDDYLAASLSSQPRAHLTGERVAHRARRRVSHGRADGHPGITRQ